MSVIRIAAAAAAATAAVVGGLSTPAAADEEPVPLAAQPDPVLTTSWSRVAIAPPEPDPFAVLVPRPPTLVHARLVAGLLEVRILGVRPGQRAVFDVDGRRYVRLDGVLRVRCTRWTQVLAWIDQPGIARSKRLVVRADRDF